MSLVVNIDKNPSARISSSLWAWLGGNITLLFLLVSNWKFSISFNSECGQLTIVLLAAWDFATDRNKSQIFSYHIITLDYSVYYTHSQIWLFSRLIKQSVAVAHFKIFWQLSVWLFAVESSYRHRKTSYGERAHRLCQSARSIHAAKNKKGPWTGEPSRWVPAGRVCQHLAAWSRAARPHVDGTHWLDRTVTVEQGKWFLKNNAEYYIYGKCYQMSFLPL